METIVITGGRVIDGLGGEPIEDGVVIVEDEKIAAVGSADEVDVPDDAQRRFAKRTVKPPGACVSQAKRSVARTGEWWRGAAIDASGMTVMPGVIDCHQHVGFGFAALRRLQDCLRRGTTTVAAVTAGPEATKLRTAIEDGTITGCARYHVGMVVGCTFGHLRREDGNVDGVVADGPWEIRKGVRQMVQAGADFIKTAASGGFQWSDEALTFRNYTLEELHALVDEAHAWERRVMVHAHTQPGIDNSIAAGCDSIHHCALIDEAGVERLAASGLWYVPTLHITSEAAYNNEAWKKSSPHMTDRMEQASPVHRAGVRKAHEMGIPMAVGTDGQAGSAMHEMMELVDCGLSPMDAIVAGTRNSADVLGILETTGTLEAGKSADIIVVDGDPLADISVLFDADKIAVVMRDGSREMHSS